MTRVNMIVEGQTEETFVNNVLKLHLANYGVYICVRCVETGRKKGKIYRGGMGTSNVSVNPVAGAGAIES